MKRLTEILNPYANKMEQAHKRGEKALDELTKACVVYRDKKKASVSNEFKLACI